MNEMLTMTLPGLLLSLITFFLTRRKYLAEVELAHSGITSSELDNVEKAAKIWRELSEELRVRLSKDIEDLRNENGVMKSQFLIVMEENQSLKSQMQALEKQLKEARCENGILLKELKKFNANYPDTSFKKEKL